VCQDFTHLMLGLLRLRQIPCRYVSGYLHLGGGDEAAQSHAWVRIHSPTHGGVPFDPTHNREIDERYVVVGHGRHYDDVPPNKGIYRGNADEGLRTAVRTQESAPKDISALHEEMEQIDVPVYQEIPERRRDRSRPAAAGIAAPEQPAPQSHERASHEDQSSPARREHGRPRQDRGDRARRPQPGGPDRRRSAGGGVAPRAGGGGGAPRRSPSIRWATSSGSGRAPSPCRPCSWAPTPTRCRPAANTTASSACCARSRRSAP